MDKPNKHLVIATDIFGYNALYQQLKLTAEIHGWRVTLLDPFDGTTQHFSDEAHAYAAFNEQCGHDGYLARLEQACSEKPMTVGVGFSAGANALWRLSSEFVENESQKIVVYPNRINRFLALNSGQSCVVMLPESEPGFDVKEIATKLIESEHQVIHFPHPHGFVNPCSSAFNQQASEQVIEWISAALAQS